MTRRYGWTLAWAGLLLAAPVQAQSVQTEATMLRHIDLHPTTARAARRVLARIDRAALDVCGASSFSLTEYRRAVRASACWRNSMADALAQSGDGLLRRTYAASFEGGRDRGS